MHLRKQQVKHARCLCSDKCVQSAGVLVCKATGSHRFWRSRLGEERARVVVDVLRSMAINFHQQRARRLADCCAVIPLHALECWHVKPVRTRGCLSG